MMHKLFFILLFAATAAAASEPAKIARSPDGNLEILQKQSDGSYVLYTRYRAGRLKTFFPVRLPSVWQKCRVFVFFS